MSCPTRERASENRLLAHVFHLISQPMTAFQCSLEFALTTLDDPIQCRTWIEAALENSERLRCRLALAREIAHAAEQVEPAQTVELRSVIEEALGEVGPLFGETAAVPLLRCDNIEVSGERGRLLRAFLYVLQHLQAADQSEPVRSEIWVERKVELIELRFLRFVLRPNLNKDQMESRLQIAKQIFESAGGGLIFFCFAGNDALIRVFLHAALAQLELYEEDEKVKTAADTIGTTALFPQVS